MNQAATGNHHPATTLLNTFHVSDMSTLHPQPQAPYVIGARDQWFGAFRQDRQREVGISATWGVALGYVRSQLPAAIKIR